MGVAQHYLIYAGKPTTEFNVWISGSDTYDAPERDVTMVDVPGRNGMLTIDNGRFDNIPVEYPAFIVKDFTNSMAAFRAFMKSFKGYQRLEDTYHPDYYRMGVLSENFDPKMKVRNLSGDFKITFDCMPQRWLKSGETFSDNITGSATIFNPTLFASKPIIRIYGTGTVQIGSYTITVSRNPVYIDVDSELMDCYYNNGTVVTNMNSAVTLSSDEFPVLEPGNNNIVANTSYIRIMPRWWTV